MDNPKSAFDLKRSNFELARYELTHNIARVKSLPTTIGIAVNETCNVRCVFCFSTIRTDSKIDWSHLKRLSSVFPHVREVILSGEEVILHPDIREMFDAFTSQGIFVNFFTNGKALTSDVMEWLVNHGVGHISCSFHGATSETYNSIVRGADFETTIEQFLHLKRYRLKRERERGRPFGPGITFHYVMLRRNVEELPRFLEIASELRADRVIAKYLLVFEQLKHLAGESLYFYPDLTNRIIDHCKEKARHLPIAFIAPLRFSPKETRAREKGLTEAEDGGSGFPICHWPWMQCNIDIHGNVKPCCGRVADIGNIYETPFEEIWNNDRYVALRSTVNTPNRWPECRQCNYLTSTVDNNDIFSHLPYLEGRDPERVEFTPIALNGRFTVDQALFERALKTYTDLKKGGAGMGENIPLLAGLLPEQERNHLVRRLQSLQRFDPHLFLLIMIRFLNQFSRSAVSHRLIQAWAGEASVARRPGMSVGRQILVENFLSQMNMGCYEDARRSFPSLQDIIGHSNHAYLRGLMEEMDWRSIRSQLDEYLDRTLEAITANDLPGLHAATAPG